MAFLLERGAERIVYPFEGDLDNLEALAEAGLPPWLEVAVYAYIPLFVSRALIKGKGRREVTDRLGERFFLHRRDGLTHLVGRRPYCAFSYRKRLADLGVRHLRMSIPAGLFASADLPRLVRSYERGADVAGSTPFNLERGLR